MTLEQILGAIDDAVAGMSVADAIRFLEEIETHCAGSREELEEEADDEQAAQEDG